MKMRVDKINSEGRIRENMGEIDELAKSIEKHGLIHPPVISKDGTLVAGGRRYEACKELGLDEIEVRLVEDLDDLERREIELEENLVRKDFTWQEEVKSKSEIHKIKQEQHGKRVKGHESDGWGIADTAETLNESLGTVSQDIQLAEAIERYPEVGEKENKHKAWKTFKKLQKEEEMQAMLDKLQGREGTDMYELLNVDALDWLKSRESESIDLVIADPPWGIGMDNRRLGRERDLEYTDDIDVVDTIIEPAINECYRILKDGSHLYLFFGIRHYNRMVEIVDNAGFDYDVVPIIWNKDHAGSAAKLRTYPKAYETILFCYKGKRDLNTTHHDVFTVSKPSGKRRIHSAQKPIELQKMLVEASSMPSEIVLDPFAGSGSTVVGAVQADRRAIGLEKDEHNFASMVKFVRKYTSPPHNKKGA